MLCVGKVPTALAEHVEKNNLQGKLKYNLFVGASSGAETENRWARNNMVSSCFQLKWSFSACNAMLILLSTLD